MSHSSEDGAQYVTHDTSINGNETTTNDKALLAALGYKQELKRKFTVVELFGFGFSISAIVPSVA